jgi:peptidoglycan/LPS O-acetylase OafA/YrhL
MASLSVAIAHIYGVFFHKIYYNTNDTTVKIFLEFIVTGGFGVSIFFLVSGFIIPLSFSNIRSFFIRRVVRIYPAYFVAVLISLCISEWSFQKDVFFSYTLVLADLVKAPSTLAGVDWTLRIEVIFYLYVGLLMWKNKLNYSSVLITAVVLVIINIMIKMFNIDITPRPFIYFYLFLIGVLFYINYKNLTSYQHLKKASVIVAVLFFIAFKVFELPPYNQFTYPFLAIGIFYLFIKNISANLEDYRVITFFSNCSYPLYLLHNVIFEKITLFFIFFNNAYLIHFVSWASLLIFCYLMHIFIEKPFISLGKRFS